jgi:protein kinase
LRAEFYNSPVDIWAAGVIMFELLSGKVLFQGNSETDQIYKIVGVLGTPTQTTWPDGLRLANRLGIRFPSHQPVGMAGILPNVSAAAIGLIGEMLKFDPAKRPSASRALQHDFFKVSPGEELAPQPQPKAPALDDILNTFTQQGNENQEPERQRLTSKAALFHEEREIDSCEELFQELDG